MNDYQNDNSVEWICGVLFVISLLVIFGVAWAIH